VLYAYDATNIAQPIYSSEENPARDRASLATRFVVPVVVNGRVYFGTGTGLKSTACSSEFLEAVPFPGHA
jgi:hypothetical protein